MNIKELERAQRELDNAGTPDNKETARFKLVDTITYDLETLRSDLKGVEVDFRAYQSRWTTETVSDDVNPHVRDEDRDEFRIMFWSALTAIAGEAGLAGWTFKVQSVNPWYGVASALIITGLLHGGLSFVLNDKERPKVMIDRLRRYFFRPSLIAFAVAAAIGLPVRYVHGVMALIGRDIFPVALSFATFALLTLAAALLTAHSKMKWAVRFERHWHSLRRLIRDNETLLHLLSPKNAEDAPSPVIPIQKTDAARSDMTMVQADRRP
jgi:hypothetical protein